MNKIAKFLTFISIVGFVLCSLTGCLYDVNTNGSLSNHENILAFLALCGISGLTCLLVTRMPIIGIVLLSFVLIG